MTSLSPGKMMLLGFSLLLLGFVLPFLMVLRILEPTLLLGFVAYLTSLLGLVIGVIGIVFYSHTRR